MLCSYVEELSEGDLLSQYFFSNSKKLKTEDMEHQDVVGTESVVHHSKDISSNKDCSPESQPKLRNKFALILQKKNEETGAVIVPGTRSRYVHFKLTLWNLRNLDAAVSLHNKGSL